MRDVTAFFILFAPWLVFTVDVLVLFYSGPSATITGVVREWARQSIWPEFFFLLGVLIMYVHLFRQ